MLDPSLPRLAALVTLGEIDAAAEAGCVCNESARSGVRLAVVANSEQSGGTSDAERMGTKP
jgi:hypothetical protein